MTNKDEQLRRVNAALKTLADVRTMVNSSFNALASSSVEILDGASDQLKPFLSMLPKLPELDATQMLQVNNALVRAKAAIDTVKESGWISKYAVWDASVSEAIQTWIDDPGANVTTINSAVKSAGKGAASLVKTAVTTVTDFAGDTLGALTKGISDALKKLLGPLWWVLGLVILAVVGYVLFLKFGRG